MVYCIRISICNTTETASKSRFWQLWYSVYHILCTGTVPYDFPNLRPSLLFTAAFNVYLSHRRVRILRFQLCAILLGNWNFDEVLKGVTIESGLKHGKFKSCTPPVDMLNFDLAFWETYRLAFQSKLFFFLFLKRKILISSNYPFTSFSEVALSALWTE
jgi:hypothetical protein